MPEEVFDFGFQTDLPDASNLRTRCVSAIPLDASGAAILEIVLDGSGSMDTDGKWIAATTALSAIFDDLAARSDPMLAVGLLVFEDAADTTSGEGPYPTPIDVGPKVVDATQHALLQRRIETLASGGTPTLLALEGAYRMLENFTPTPPTPAGGQRVVVLLSDGVPNGGSAEQDQCISLARANNAGADPIRTFAVGIGPFPGSAFSYNPTFMSELAIAGGTSASPTCRADTTSVRNVCHFQITPGGRPTESITQDFVQAMNDIRGKLAPACEFNLVGNVANANLDTTTVVWIDGTRTARPVPRNATTGWSFDNASRPTHITIHGALCRDILADPGGYVDVRFTCAAPR